MLRIRVKCYHKAVLGSEAQRNRKHGVIAGALVRLDDPHKEWLAPEIPRLLAPGERLQSCRKLPIG